MKNCGIAVAVAIASDPMADKSTWWRLHVHVLVVPPQFFLQQKQSSSKYCSQVAVRFNETLHLHRDTICLFDMCFLASLRLCKQNSLRVVIENVLMLDFCVQQLQRRPQY